MGAPVVAPEVEFKEGVEAEVMRIEGIIATCTSHGCDLIVMASHGRRGLAKLLLGSQATKVLTMSSVPVLVCR